jgi:ABC-2 type transport system permease protein
MTATADLAPARRAATWTGASTLLRIGLRRDRARILAWVAGIAGFLVASAVGLGDVVPDARARATRAELMSSPTIRALRGPGYGLDDYTYGAMIAHELLLFGAVAVALMSVLLVMRHTRAEEESGRTELLRAGVLGRHAPMVAALGIATVAIITTAAATTLGLLATVPELDTIGATVFGLSLAGAGAVFAAVGAVCAQLSEDARSANGISGSALATVFMVRAVGDAGGVDDQRLSWLSPLAWTQATRPFVDERLWPLGLSLLLALTLTAIAASLANRRDLGAGLIPPRPGPVAASSSLSRPLGFAWRLHRGSLLGWAFGLAVLGASFGAIIGDIDAFLADNPQLADILGSGGSDLLDAFLATVMIVIGLLAAGFAVQAAARLQTEELSGRAEPLLATPLTRTRWAMSHLTVALAGGAVVAVAGGVGLGVGAALDQADPRMLVELTAAGLVYAPAIWVTAGLVAWVHGLGARAPVLGWLVIAYGTFIGLLAEVLDLPASVRDLSPFHHIPALPGAPLDLAGLGRLSLLAALALVLVAGGLAGLARRDLRTL